MELDYSERRACGLIGIHRATYQYRSRRKDDSALRDRMLSIARERPRFGYRRVYVMLRREGFRVNHKRVYRLYRAEGLAVRKRKRKRINATQRQPHALPTRPNQRWSMDFVSDGLGNGRRFRTLNIVDDFSRECLAIEADFSLPGERVARVLDALIEVRGKPEAIVIDNGPEFAGKALDTWSYERGVALLFIRPGKPIENAFIESFNGRFRDECLNQNWFLSMKHARALISAWKEDYNTVRPHSALGNIPPAEFLLARTGVA
ncbi:IS2 transposase TnpB [compost metagenome]